MFVEFKRKDSGALVKINPSKVVTFNVDDDGVGTMIVLEGDIPRPVVESVDQVYRELASALKHRGHRHYCD